MADHPDVYLYSFVPGIRTNELQQAFNDEQKFSESIDSYRWDEPAVVSVFLLSFDEHNIHGAAVGRRHGEAATGMHKVYFAGPYAHPVSAISWQEILLRIPAEFQHLFPRLTAGGGLTPELWLPLLEAISSVDADFARGITQLDASVRSLGLRQGPKHIRQQLDQLGFSLDTALGTEARRTVLRATASNIDWQQVEAGSSVLAALRQSDRYVERASIEHDKDIFPGLSRISGLRALGGGAVFANKRGDLLFTLVVDKTQVETHTGSDLIYYDEDAGSAVLIQYKEMRRHSPKSEPCYYPNSDNSFEGELASLRAFADRFECDSGDLDPWSLRLHRAPAFFKFCDPPDTITLGNGDLIKGMYISTDHWLTVAQNARGPNDGVRIDRTTVQRQLPTTMMIELIKGRWLGTRRVPFEQLLSYIEERIENERTLLLAKQKRAS